MVKKFLCWLNSLFPSPPTPIDHLVVTMKSIERRWNLEMEMVNERALLENIPPPYTVNHFLSEEKWGV
jgi:hypothetical protein